MSDDILDSDLLEQCLSEGSERAWELFVQRYSRLIWSSIHKTFKASSCTYGQEDVEDIYSALFLSLVEEDFRRLRQFQARNACSLSTWLTVVAVRRTIDHMRRRPSRDWGAVAADDAQAESVADPRQDIESLLTEAQEQEELARTLRSLSDSDRRVYELLYLRGLAPEAAARELNTTTAALYTKKHRLIEKIKRSLAGA